MVERGEAMCTNWHGPLMWQQIEVAQRAVGWNPTVMAKWLACHDAEIFGQVVHKTICDWIDKTEKFNPGWTDSAKVMAAVGDHQSVL